MTNPGARPCRQHPALHLVPDIRLVVYVQLVVPKEDLFRRVSFPTLYINIFQVNQDIYLYCFVLAGVFTKYNSTKYILAFYSGYFIAELCQLT